MQASFTFSGGKWLGACWPYCASTARACAVSLLYGTVALQRNIIVIVIITEAKAGASLRLRGVVIIINTNTVVPVRVLILLYYTSGVNSIFKLDPSGTKCPGSGTEIIPGKHPDTRIKPFPLTNGHGRYMTVTRYTRTETFVRSGMAINC